MRQQVGWYDPKYGSLWSNDMKATLSEDMQERLTPIFDSPCKESRDDDPHEATCRKLSLNAKLWHEIQLQILENQRHLLQQHMRCPDSMFMPTADLVTETNLLLKKGRKSL